jgi:hypothetical protein
MRCIKHIFLDKIPMRIKTTHFGIFFFVKSKDLLGNLRRSNILFDDVLILINSCITL